MGLAVITGASSGIGESFAAQLAAQGWDLLLVARRADRLEALAARLAAAHKVRAAVLTADLATEAGISAVAERLRAEPQLELLVSNAGFGTLGLFWETDFARQTEMHRLHVLATLTLSRAALEGMTARNKGAIINVSSVAGFFRSPGSVSYCATKGWMNDFTEGLWLELANAGLNVRVQSLCPGFTYTEFHDVMGVDRSLVARALWMPVDFVVAESIRALASNQLFVVPGWRYKLIVALASLLPNRLRLAIERRSPHRKGRDAAVAR